MWIITGQRDFYFVCGIFVWTIPRPWSSRSSNIEVRQTSITSHLTTFYHVARVAGFKREKGRGGGFWRSGNGVKSAQFPLLPLSPFNACTQAEWSPRRNCFCCHALWWGAVHDVKNTATQYSYVVCYTTVLCVVTQRFFQQGGRRVVWQRKKRPNYRRNFYLPLLLLRCDSQMYE